MKTLALILAFAAVAAAQKPLKAKHKPAYIASSPGSGIHGGDIGGSSQAYQAAAPQSHHGGSYGGSHHSPSYSSGIGKGASKQNYPLLLSDTRTLNSDGTINFNYQADNGLHQGETVDSDGTRRGFYSYPGADGKLITVKYSAGKNGFVAEGDHLPTQPQSAPYNAKQDSDIYSPKQGSHQSHGGGHYGGGSSGHYSASPIGGGGHSGAYRPSHSSGAGHYSHSSGGVGGIGQGAFANFPDFSSQFGSSGHGGHSGHRGGHGAGAGRYSGAAASSGHHGGGGHVSGHPGGSSSFASLHGLGSSGHGGASFPDIGSLGSTYSGPMFTANNPYQPHSTGPVNAGFDLGNGGHFAINFTPGVGQEYNPGSGGDYSSTSHGQGAGSGGHGSQGRY